MRRLLLVLTGLCLFACRDGGTKRVDPPPPPPACLDGTLNEGEECDGSDLGGATCASLGFESGPLTCTSECKLSTTLCVRKKCGNGALDPGETCDGTLGVPPCTSYGYVECTDACALDQRHCITQVFETAPSLMMSKGGPSVLGDVSPRGPGDLVMAVPSFGRLEAIPWVTQVGFDATAGRKLSFQRTPVRPAVADLNGDGNQDLAAVNADGTMDSYTFNGTGFTARAYADAGCPGGTFAGRGRFAPDAGEALLVLGCGDGVWLLGGGGARWIAVPAPSAAAVGDLTGDGLADVLTVDQGGTVARVLAAPDFAADAGQGLTATATAAALGDLDGDGDLDLAFVSGADVKLFENTGAGFAEKLTFSGSAARGVAVLDMDLDGRADVFWADLDDVLVRRNRGAWSFVEYRHTAGTGQRLSVSAGDADGDGDPDVAVTVSTGPDSTRTDVVRNRVR